MLAEFSVLVFMAEDAGKIFCLSLLLCMWCCGGAFLGFLFVGFFMICFYFAIFFFFGNA